MPEPALINPDEPPMMEPMVASTLLETVGVVLPRNRVPPLKVQLPDPGALNVMPPLVTVPLTVTVPAAPLPAPKMAMSLVELRHAMSAPPPTGLVQIRLLAFQVPAPSVPVPAGSQTRFVVCARADRENPKTKAASPKARFRDGKNRGRAAAGFF